MGRAGSGAGGERKLTSGWRSEVKSILARFAPAPLRRRNDTPLRSPVHSIVGSQHCAASTMCAMSFSGVVALTCTNRMSRYAPAAMTAPSAIIVISVLPVWRGAMTNVRDCSTRVPNMAHSRGRAAS